MRPSLCQRSFRRAGIFPYLITSHTLVYRISMRFFSYMCCVAAIASGVLFAQTFALDSAKGLQTKLVTVEPANYMGRKCVRVAPAGGGPQGGGGGLAIVSGTDFHDGT